MWGKDITRVTVGRIELVTPAQRTAIARIGISELQQAQQLYTGLGRFRDALLLDEQRRRPTPGLDHFLQWMNIAYFQP